jgi:hypothetical protein
MHKNATKCNETLSKWCKNKHGASTIIDTFETYQGVVLYFPEKPPKPKGLFANVFLSSSWSSCMELLGAHRGHLLLAT